MNYIPKYHTFVKVATLVQFRIKYKLCIFRCKMIHIYIGCASPPIELFSSINKKIWISQSFRKKVNTLCFGQLFHLCLGMLDRRNGTICHVMSCHVMSCHVMSCHVMSCHVMSCHVMCHVMSCHGMACHVMAWHGMACHVKAGAIRLPQTLSQCVFV